jgi:flagellar motor switch protein FliN/FliY
MAEKKKPLTEADHLDDQLGGDEPDGDELGVEEALQAWAAGGHAAEDVAAGEAVKPVQFAQLDVHALPRVKPQPGRLNNVWVEVTVELGRVDMSVKQLVDLKEQSVIELDKLAGEAFSIRVNDRPFAEGEIVIVTDMMGVRITRMIELKTTEAEAE